jgi:protein-disulfide isomerase
MVRLLIAITLIFLPNVSFSADCPSLPRVRAVLNKTLGISVTVKSVKEVPQFNSCMVKTLSGETFFFSKDGKYLIEGLLLKVPELKFNEKELRFFKRKTLFSIGKGKKEIFLFTNPACEACKKNRELLFKLSNRFKIRIIPLGFKGKEFKAAVSAYCLQLRGRNFFNVRKFKVCDEGKLKVWSIADKFKKMGITGTPVAVLQDGRILIGVKEIKELLQN